MEVINKMRGDEEIGDEGEGMSEEGKEKDGCQSISMMGRDVGRREGMKTLEVKEERGDRVKRLVERMRGRGINENIRDEDERV